MSRAAAEVRADLSLALIESLIIVVAYVAALSLRFLDSPGGIPPSWWRSLLLFLPVLLIVHVGTNALFGNYGHVWKYASIDEAVRLFAGTATAAVILAVGMVVWRLAGHDGPIPVSVLVIGLLLTSLGMGAVRFWSRLFAYRRYGESGLADRALVVGVDDDAVRLARHRSHSRGSICVVGFVDPSGRPVDSLRKLAGLHIYGSVDDIAELVERYDIDQVIIATENAGRLSRRVVDLCMEVDVRLRIVPNMDVLLEDGETPDMRDLTLTDLLPRQQVETDLGAVERLIAGRVVLITGGGGSIGSELVRQTLSWGPAKLIALDHDETLLHDAVSTFGDPVMIAELADIRDERRLNAIFEKHRPDLVFHAAAHKHVPILEDYPSEAAKTNVIGTRNVITAAKRVGTKRLVVISTDKAVDPSSVMGASKRIAEMLVQTEATTDIAPMTCAVRFGNVLGSRGSVVPTFARQIRDGGPVTVSDPAMERYFMTVSEAVELVLQAAVLSEGGEVFVLDMGEPVRIMDLAHRMIRLAGLVPDKDIRIALTGRRPGEKSTEILSLSPLHRTAHEKVLVAHPPVPGASQLMAGVDRLQSTVDEASESAIREQLHEIAAAEPAIELDLRDREVIDLTDGATEPSQSGS